MKKILIGIHGLGNKPSKDVLQDWWVQSIREGLESIGRPRKDIPFELIYWADVSYPVPLDHACTNPEDPSYVEDPYVKSLFKDVKNKPSLKAKLLRYIDGQLNRLFLNDDLSINFKEVSDQIIHRYFSDLDRYLNGDRPSVHNPECSARAEIRDRFMQVLEKYHGDEILLIAHSMGSIIAFDVLSEMSDQFDIDTFVTIGSPLGIPVMVGRAFAEQKQRHPSIARPATPDCIWPHWINLADPEDKVALDVTLYDDYGPNRLGTGPVDMAVFNDYEINGSRNPHKSYGYLRTPQLAQVLNEFLSRKYLAGKFRRAVKIARSMQGRLRRRLKRHG